MVAGDCERQLDGEVDTPASLFPRGTEVLIVLKDASAALFVDLNEVSAKLLLESKLDKCHDPGSRHLLEPVDVIAPKALSTTRLGGDPLWFSVPRVLVSLTIVLRCRRHCRAPDPDPTPRRRDLVSLIVVIVRILVVTTRSRGQT